MKTHTNRRPLFPEYLPGEISARTKMISTAESYDARHLTFGRELKNAYSELRAAADKLGAYCIPMYCHYTLHDAGGLTLFSSNPVLIGQQIDCNIDFKPHSSCQGYALPLEIRRQPWRLKIDIDAAIPSNLRSKVKTVKLHVREAVDIDNLHKCVYYLTCCYSRYHRVAIDIIPAEASHSCRSIEISHNTLMPDKKSPVSLLDSKLDRRFSIYRHIKSVILRKFYSPGTCDKYYEIAHLKRRDPRELANSVVYPAFSGAELNSLVTDSDTVRFIISADRHKFTDTICRISDKTRLVGRQRIGGLRLGHKNTRRSDTVIVAARKFLRDMCPETAYSHYRADQRHRPFICIGHKPRLPVALLSRIGVMPHTFSVNCNCFHQTEVLEVQRSQSVIHQSQMRIDRRIGDHHSVAHSDSVRREIPYAFDPGGDHSVGDVLRAVYRHSDYADAYVKLLYKLFKSVDVIDRYAADLGTHDIGIDIYAGNYVEPVPLKARVGNQCRSQTARPDHHRIVRLAETEKILQRGFKRGDFISYPRFSFYIEKRKIFGYLRRVYVKLIGYFGRRDILDIVLAQQRDIGQIPGQSPDCRFRQKLATAYHLIIVHFINRYVICANIDKNSDILTNFCPKSSLAPQF